MRMALATALGAGVVWLAGAGGHPSRHLATSLYRTEVDSTLLAKELVGKWAGTQYDSGSTAGNQFTMIWKMAADGHLSGKVNPASASSYDTRVVWSSDTGFVTESAPHKSTELKEDVVTRTVSHLKGDSLWGKFEMRPMTYQGRSVEGHFTASREK